MHQHMLVTLTDSGAFVEFCVFGSGEPVSFTGLVPGGLTTFFLVNWDMESSRRIQSRTT